MLSPAQEAMLARLAADARMIVVFCRPRCWASWNLAKRLAGQRHARVAWYRDGIDGWQERHPTAPVTPDAKWASYSAVSAR